MMNNNPLVSIVTVSYNAVATIEQTILSVLNQSYSNIEYIIIDGGSTDGTVDIIKKYADKITYWVSEPDKGIYDAMNKGIDKVSGELVGIINSDDWYEEDAFKNVVEKYTYNPKSVFHGNLRLIGDTTKVLKPKFDTSKYYYGSFLMHPTMFVPTTLYKEIGKFDIKYRIAADYDLMLRIYHSNYTLHYIDTILSNMRLGGVSDTNIIDGYTEVKQIAIKNNYSFFKVYLIYILKVIRVYYYKLKK